MKYWSIFRCLGLVLIALLFVQSRAALAQAQATPISLDEYKVRLEQAAQTLAQGIATSTSLTTTNLTTTNLTTTNLTTTNLLIVQKELAAIQTVRLPSGQRVTLQPLLGTPDTKPPTQAIALARVQLVLDQLKAAANDNTAARLALLDEVLAQPEFNTPLSLWERFLRWLRSFLPEPTVTPTNNEAEPPSQLVTWIIAGVGGILLILLLSYWLQGLLGNFVTDFEARRRAESGEEVLLTASAARQQATELARTGNYRDAVRQLYLSALLSLEERNLITYDRSLTNREVLAQMRNRPTVQNHLQPVVETFDDVWYGIHEPDQATFTGYEREIDQLVESAQDGRADKGKG